MVAGIELEQYATGHETSNQQSRKQSFPNTNLDRLGKTGNYLQLRSFTFCTAQSSGAGGFSMSICASLPSKMPPRND